MVWRRCRRARRAPHGVRQQARPGAGRLRAHPRPAPGRASAPASPRSSCRSAWRPASAASPTCSPTRPSSTTPTAPTTEDEIPDDTGRRSSTRCTTTSSRGSSWPTTTCWSATSRATCRASKELEHTLAARRRRRPASSRSCAARPSPGVGRRPPGRPHLRDRSVARRPPRHGPAPVTPRSRSPPTPAASRSPSCSRRSPTRTSGQLSLFKVLSGTIKADDQLVNPRTGADERLHGLFLAAGQGAGARRPSVVGRRHRRPWPSWPTPAPATRWRPRARRSRVPPIEPPPAVLGHRRQGPHPGRRRQAGARPSSASRTRTRRWSSSATTRPTRRCCGAPARRTWPSPSSACSASSGSTSTPRTCGSPTGRPSRGTAEAEGKYKKQSGGHGQFGVAWLRVEPLERGAGFEFVDKIVGGAIPRQFIPAVAKGVEETMAPRRRARLPGRRRPRRVLRRQVPLRRLARR